MTRWIREIVEWWDKRRRRAALYRSDPKMREIDRAEREAIRARNMRAVHRARESRQQRLHAALRGTNPASASGRRA